MGLLFECFVWMMSVVCVWVWRHEINEKKKYAIERRAMNAHIFHMNI